MGSLDTAAAAGKVNGREEKSDSVEHPNARFSKNHYDLNYLTEYHICDLAHRRVRSRSLPCG